MTAAASDPLAAAKRELRRRMLAQREAFVAASDSLALARAAAEAFPLDPARPPRIVSGFHRIGAEIDPAPLMTRLAAAGARLCLPVVVEPGLPLAFRALAPAAELVPDVAGIPAPPPSSPALVPDLVLVPLLAFDGEGWRLGYGGGYFDRSLAALRAAGAVTALGMAFSMQEAAAVPHGPADQPLDAILTQSGYKAFLHKDV